MLIALKNINKQENNYTITLYHARKCNDLEEVDNDFPNKCLQNLILLDYFQFANTHFKAMKNMELYQF